MLPKAHIEIEDLRKMRYFYGLSSSELEEVRGFIALDQTVEKGEVFIMEGVRSDYLYLLVSGLVKVYQTSPDGKEQILHIATPGDSMNDVSTFDGGPNAASMLAITPVYLYGIRKTAIAELFLEHPRVAINACHVLAMRVRNDSTLIRELSFENVTARLARMLLKYHKAVSDEWPRLTQHDIAAMIGTTREVVNRSLRTLEEQGAIRTGRHGVVILKPKALEDLVQSAN